MSKRDGIERMEKIGIVIALCVVVFTAGTVVVSIQHFDNQMYPIQKAEAYLTLANSTTNLTQITVYLSDTMGIIQHYHGNPQWWYPTNVANWTYIQQDILSIQYEITQFNKTANVSGISYNQMIGNAHNAIGQVNNLLSNQQWWVGIELPFGILDMIYAIVFVFVIAMAFVYSGRSWNDEDMAHYLETFFLIWVAVMFASFAILLTL